MSENQPVQIDPDEAGVLANDRVMICPSCGSSVEEDSVWFRFQRFYCSQDCAIKARQPEAENPYNVINAWEKALEVRRADD